MAAKKQIATVSKIIDLITNDLDVLREYWRIRKGKKSKISGDDVKTFIGKLDNQIEFWHRLQILNADSPVNTNTKCLKCAVGKDKRDKVKRKDFSGQTETIPDDPDMVTPTDLERVSTSIVENEGGSAIELATNYLLEAQQSGKIFDLGLG